MPPVNLHRIGMVMAALSVISSAPVSGQGRLAMFGRVWVTNQSTNDVTAFDALTGRVLCTAAVGTRPIGIVAPPTDDHVYVSAETSNRVDVVSKSTCSIVRSIPTGLLPHHMSHSRDGSRVYVAEFGANSISVIDTRTMTLVRFATGAPAARTHAVFPTHDGRRLLVTNSVVNEVAALDATTGALEWAVPVGVNPSEIIPSHDGRYAYVSIRNEHKIQVINLAERTVIRDLLVGTEPDTLQLTESGRQLIIGLRGRPARAAVVNTRDWTVRHIDLPGMTTGHNALSTGGFYSFMALEGDAPAVAIFDNVGLRLLRLYAYPGGGRPHGVYYERGER